MTKTKYFVAASIDGYIADTEGRLDWLFQFNDADGVMDHYRAFLDTVGAIVMGALTYEFMLNEKLDAWPYPKQPTWVFTHRELPKYPHADIRFTREDVGIVHRQAVEAARGKDIWLVGGGNLVAQFSERGLLDEILLGIAPVVLGGGTPLLPARIPNALRLAAIERFGQGFVELRYLLHSEAS